MKFTANPNDFSNAILDLVYRNCFPFDPQKTNTPEPLVLIIAEHPYATDEVSFHLVAYDKTTQQYSIYFEDPRNTKEFLSWTSTTGHLLYPIVPLKTLVSAATLFTTEGEVEVSFSENEISFQNELCGIVVTNPINIRLETVDFYSLEPFCPFDISLEIRSDYYKS